MDQAVPCLECAGPLSRQLFEKSKVEYDTRCGPIFVTLSHLLERANVQYQQDVTAATPGRYEHHLGGPRRECTPSG